MRKPHIYVPCPDTEGAFGGVKTIYRQVQVLSSMGYPAFVVHRDGRSRVSFFENTARVESFQNIDLHPEDLLVLPEVYQEALNSGRDEAMHRRLRRALTERLGRPASAIQLDETRALVAQSSRIVVLNLNGFNVVKSFQAVGDDGLHPFDQPKVEAMIVVSRQNEQMMRLAFPTLPVHYFHKSVDPSIFQPVAPKENRICYFNRKRRETIRQVITIAKRRRSFRDFDVTAMQSLSEAQVARVMGSSKVFLSFSSTEGLPRPPMEAMMAGCIVVGFHGQGGRDYMLPELTHPVEADDYSSFIESLETVMDELVAHPEQMKEKAEAARRYVIENYSPEREEQELASIWKQLVEPASSSRGTS